MPVRATMVKMGANEAKDVHAQYGSDIVDNVAETLWNHTGDMVGHLHPLNLLSNSLTQFEANNNLSNSATNNTVDLTQTLNNQAVDTVCLGLPVHLMLKVLTRFEDNNNLYTEATSITAPSHQASLANNRPRPSYQDAEYLARRVLALTDPLVYQPPHHYAPRHTIERHTIQPKTAGYRAPYSHTSGLGMGPTVPATVGLDISVGFPAPPGYSGSVGDITVGDMAIDPNLEDVTCDAETNTNGEECAGALFDKMLENNGAGVYDNVLENNAAGVYDNMLGNDAGAVAVDAGAGAGADASVASYSNGQDDMPAPRGRGRPRGIKRKASSDDQQDNKPAARVRMTPPGPPVTLDNGKPSLTASLGDPVIPSAFQRKLPSLVDAADPVCCHLCYHCFIQKPTLRDHYYEKHKELLGLTRKGLNDYHYAKRENMKTLSWYKAQGFDTTYTGTDRKQINTRRRMDAGLRTTDPAYLRDVYKETSSEKNKSKKSN